MSEEFKLRQTAEDVRRLILALSQLISSTEMPIELDVKIIEGHKNLNTVWKEIGFIPLNQQCNF